MFFLSIFLLTAPIQIDENWLNLASSRVDQDAVSWAQEALKNSKESSPKKQCQSDASFINDLAPQVYVCMSFSVPEEVWANLSKELEKIGGVIALRGLPHNSFKELALRIRAFSSMGVKAPIQIHPKLFLENAVESVPTFLILNNGRVDKLTGNISLYSALEKMEAKYLLRLMQEGSRK